MKVAESSLVFKKLGNFSKNNYQPVCMLLEFAKLFKSIIYSQLNDYMEKKLYLNTLLAFVGITKHRTSS